MLHSQSSGSEHLGLRPYLDGEAMRVKLCITVNEAHVMPDGRQHTLANMIAALKYE